MSQNQNPRAQKHWGKSTRQMHKKHLENLQTTPSPTKGSEGAGKKRLCFSFPSVRQFRTQAGRRPSHPHAQLRQPVWHAWNGIGHGSRKECMKEGVFSGVSMQSQHCSGIGGGDMEAWRYGMVVDDIGA
jgi:hypothetical protein